MGSRERPATDACVGLHPWGIHQLHVGRSLCVPELPDVEVALLAVDRDDPFPPEHDVCCGLHHPLALDDALPVLLESAPSEERLEHRLLRLLELQEQRIVVVSANEQQDPGTRTDAADSDDLPCRMHVLVALEKV